MKQILEHFGDGMLAAAAVAAVTGIFLKVLLPGGFFHAILVAFFEGISG